MKFRMFFVVAALLAMYTLASAQASGIALYDDSIQLTVSCSGGAGLPDGSLCEIYWDQNANGPDVADALAPVGSAQNQITYNTFLMNGNDPNVGIGEGYFWNFSVLYAGGLGVPTVNRYYVVAHGVSVKWTSAIFSFPAPGLPSADYFLGGWACTVTETPCVAPASVTLTPGAPVCWQACPNQTTVLYAACPALQPPLVTLNGLAIPPSAWTYTSGLWSYIYAGTAREQVCATLDGCSPPPCQATPLVLFQGSRDNGVGFGYPAYSCADLCANAATVIRVCSPTGAPLDPAKLPILSIVSGCAPVVTHCDRTCAGGVADLMGVIPPTAWTYVGGCFEITLHGVTEGCVCVGFEGFLSAELASFTTTAMDNSVAVNFTTASENNLTRFEVLRSVKGHEASEVVGILTAANVATGTEYSFVDNSALNGTTYVYGLAVVEGDGARRVYDITSENTPSYNAAVITEYALHQNFPNPFNPTTQITFDLVSSNLVNLKVYNINGQLVSEMVNGTMEAGRHTISFDAANLTSGLYFYTVKIGNEFSATKKMMLLK